MTEVECAFVRGERKMMMRKLMMYREMVINLFQSFNKASKCD